MKENDKYCLFVIDVLYSYLNKTDEIFKLDDSKLKCPIFVTWKTRNDHLLRGCIGTTNPINILEGLRNYSLISALEDNRFSPIKASELENLVCTVSLLIDYEDCITFDDWTIGIHGISFELQDIDRNYKALYLPEVMIEHGFSHKETMESLLRKSGYRKPITNDLLHKLKLTRFKSKKESVGVDCYLQMRKNA